MNGVRTKSHVIAISVALTFWLVASMQHFAYHFFIRKAVQKEINVPAVPSPYFLRAISMGNDGAVAMSVWLRLLPYVGEVLLLEREKELDWNFIAAGIKAILDIDEYFYDGYLYATCFLDQNPAYLDLSIQLGEKGTHKLTSKWDIPFFTAMNYLLYKNDRENAARLIRIAASRPKAPAYVYEIAGSYFYKEGDYRKIIEYYRRAINEGNILPVMKGYIQLELKEVENLYVLQEAVNKFKKKFGRLPDSLQELVEKGIISEIPKSPFGKVKYFLDKTSGLVRSTHSGFSVKWWNK